MWNYEQLIALQLTPATSKRAPQLNEKYRALVFAVPHAGYDLVLPSVDPQPCSRSNHRVHRDLTFTEMRIDDVLVGYSSIHFQLRYQTRFDMLLRLLSRAISVRGY